LDIKSRNGIKKALSILPDNIKVGYIELAQTDLWADFEQERNHRFLYVAEKYCIPKDAVNEMRILYPQLPSADLLKGLRDNLAKAWVSNYNFNAWFKCC
jgi:hypothetical protein